MKQKRKVSNIIWITVLTVASLLWIYPIVMILFNSLKKETAISTSTAFTLPTADTFAGISNYVSSLTSQGFLKSLGYSTLITVTSVAAILLCCSMCAWCITRLNGVFSKIIYYMCVLSMVVPFQMVMFTLSQTADKLKHTVQHLGDLPRIWCGTCGIYVLRPCKIHSDRDRGSCHDRRLQSTSDILHGGCTDFKTNHDFSRCSGSYVGMERLPSADTCTGY